MREKIFIETLLFWIAGLFLLEVSNLLGYLGGVIAENAGALPAVYFFVAPLLWLKRKNLDQAEIGFHLRETRTAILHVVALALIVFPPYIFAYFFWSEAVAGTHPCLPAHPVSYYGSSVRGRPAYMPSDRAIYVWLEGEFLYTVSSARTELNISGCSCPVYSLRLQDGAVKTAQLSGPCHAITQRLEPNSGLACATSDSDTLTLTAEPPLQWRQGFSSVPAEPGALILKRSIFWLPELLLLHLFAVALPEEVFFRGFIQTRLALVMRRRLRILNAPVGLHIIVSSALFAISHLVAEPHPYRLAVFFPGLLFGWLREKTGGLLAPILFHAACNILLEFLVRFQCC